MRFDAYEKITVYTAVGLLILGGFGICFIHDSEGRDYSEYRGATWVFCVFLPAMVLFCLGLPSAAMHGRVKNVYHDLHAQGYKVISTDLRADRVTLDGGGCRLELRLEDDTRVVVKVSDDKTRRVSARQVREMCP